MPKAWFYRRHGIPLPTKGEITVGRKPALAPPSSQGAQGAAGALAASMPQPPRKRLPAPAETPAPGGPVLSRQVSFHAQLAKALRDIQHPPNHA